MAKKIEKPTTEEQKPIVQAKDENVKIIVPEEPIELLTTRMEQEEEFVMVRFTQNSSFPGKITKLKKGLAAVYQNQGKVEII